MSYKDVLSLLSGLALFLFGMTIMGQALEKRAGRRLKTILGTLTSSPFKGFLLGTAITAIIQSSSATTVMVVGFVNSGIMQLHEAIGVIMGANLGTSVTSWILSLTGLEGSNILVQIFKPATFTPVLAAVGIVFFMFCKSQKKKDTGLILLGFSVLMIGMETMSDAVEPLADMPGFTRILTMFSNPLLGVLAGTVFTAAIQSSSASVGILQALTLTGSISYATALPIIMGQNIGTCVSAMIASLGATRNARRAALVHLTFNILGTLILLPLYYLLNHFFQFAFHHAAASPLGIAVMHTAFKLLALAILMPFNSKMEKLTYLLIPESQKAEHTQLLDERLLSTPSVAIERCKTVAEGMADIAMRAMRNSMGLLARYDEKIVESVRADESAADHYEDDIGTYLVKLSARSLSENDSNESSKLLHMIGDFERISDHARNLVENVEEVKDKKLAFSTDAARELGILTSAVDEVLTLSLCAFKEDNLEAAMQVEPLEEVIDALKEQIKRQHIARLRRNECTIEMGFILNDVLVNLERVADHCSNIAGCVLEMAHESMDMHEYLRNVREGSAPEYSNSYEYYRMKYSI